MHGEKDLVQFGSYQHRYEWKDLWLLSTQIQMGRRVYGAHSLAANTCTDTNGEKGLWCSSSLAAISIDVNGRICRALVHVRLLSTQT